MLRVVTDDDGRGEVAAGLDEICREGGRRMFAAALQAEADAYVESFGVGARASRLPRPAPWNAPAWRCPAAPEPYGPSGSAQAGSAHSRHFPRCS